MARRTVQISNAGNRVGTAKGVRGTKGLYYPANLPHMTPIERARAQERNYPQPQSLNQWRGGGGGGGRTGKNEGEGNDGSDPSAPLKGSVTIPDGGAGVVVLLGWESYGSFRMRGGFKRGVDPGARHGTMEIAGYTNGTIADAFPAGAFGDDPGIAGASAAISGDNLEVTITADASGDDLVFYFTVEAEEVIP